MTRPVPRSGVYRNAPTGYVASTHGVESVFEFNGLVLNDRRRLDRFRVFTISGLDDADVRDTREVNSDGEGETPFSAQYGGRTISLTGEIQSGNLFYLRYMQEQLKAAFDDLSVERDLHIRWYDWFDEFEADTKELVLQDYDTFNGNTLFFTSGRLQAGTAEFRVIARRRTYDDYTHTLKFHTGSDVSNATISVFGRWQDTDTHIEARLTTANGLLNFFQFSRSTDNLKIRPDVPWTLLPQTDYWLRLRQERDRVQALLFDREPDPGVAPVAATLIGSTTHGEMGKGVLGNGGFGAKLGSPNGWSFEYLDLRAVNPGDMIVRCKKITKLEGTEGWDGYRFKLPFLITLRASSSLKLSRQEMTLNPLDEPFLFASGDIFFPLSGGIPFPVVGGILFGAPSGNAENLGFAQTYASVRLRGPLDNPAVLNLANSHKILLTGQIADNEYLDIDSARRTIYDQSGQSRYELLAADNNWLILEPGDNVIATGADPTVDALGRKNYAQNPSAEDVLGGQTPSFWNRLDVTSLGPLVTDVHAKYGTRSFRLRQGATGRCGMISDPIEITPGAVITAAAEFRAATISRIDCKVAISWQDINGAELKLDISPNAIDTTTGWTRTWITAAAPSDVALIQVLVTVTVPVAGEDHYVDGIIITEGSSVPDYFDGDSPGYRWDGFAHRSTSSEVGSETKGTAVVTWRHAYR